MTQRLFTTGRLSDNCQIWKRFQVCAQSLSHDAVIVYQHHANLLHHTLSPFSFWLVLTVLVVVIAGLRSTRCQYTIRIVFNSKQMNQAMSKIYAIPCTAESVNIPGATFSWNSVSASTITQAVQSMLLLCN